MPVLIYFHQTLLLKTPLAKNSMMPNHVFFSLNKNAECKSNDRMIVEIFLGITEDILHQVVDFRHGTAVEIFHKQAMGLNR